jgi:hypothetical protein
MPTRSRSIRRVPSACPSKRFQCTCLAPEVASMSPELYISLSPKQRPLLDNRPIYMHCDSGVQWRWHVWTVLVYEICVIAITFFHFLAPLLLSISQVISSGSGSTVLPHHHTIWFSSLWLCPTMHSYSSRYSAGRTVNRPRAVRSAVPILGRVRNILFCETSRPAPGTAQPLIQRVTGTSFPEVKRRGREANHSRPSGAEVNNEWRYEVHLRYTCVPAWRAQTTLLQHDVWILFRASVLLEFALLDSTY